MKRILLLLAACICVGAQAADTLAVRTFRYVGPIAVQTPYMLDDTDSKGKAFDPAKLLDTPLSFGGLAGGAKVSTVAKSHSDALHLLGFCLDNTTFAKAQISVKGLDHYALYVDGEKQNGKDLKLDPGTHQFVIKCFTKAGKAATPKVGIVQEAGGAVAIRQDGQKRYSLDLNTQGESCTGLSLSAGGKFLALTRSMVSADGKSSRNTDIIRLEDGKIVTKSARSISWMPEGDSYWLTRPTVGGRELLCVDPDSGTETVLCKDLPEGSFDIVPGGRYLIYTLVNKGPKEGDVHEILTPDDRQPGWRDRKYLARFDMRTGLMQPLTFGYHNANLYDISKDGTKLLFMSSRDRLTARPTTLSSIYVMDIASMSTQCVVQDDGFITNVRFSPRGDQLLVTGSPEALGGVGNVTPAGRIPSMYDYQLYTIDLNGGKITPLTKDFAPSVTSARWNEIDGRIYILTRDKDCKNLYRMDPSNGSFERVLNLEDNVANFDISGGAPVLVYSGQGLENGDRVYTMDIWKQKSNLIADLSAERFADVTFGKGGAYTFTNSRGDQINGFFVLPPDFNPSKKYPMIVYYYGGCSPSSRYCVGSYSPQYYAAQGFVFYVVNPSGASGFGQEFSSRHVNTAGDMVADDIIEATESFCKAHPYVDKGKIGCFSASYGGFMTQLLLTKTDLYATGISHAGISDHTSYWGEGYWGYSYSEASMAESYPWTRKDLYVDRSPLYMADRIHTPLLFLHGSADTNVPIGESIQMFTALKLLGQDTAFVVVDGENHGIRDYAKRRQWIRTIAAWFTKYLKDDPTWWDDMYPPKTL